MRAFFLLYLFALILGPETFAADESYEQFALRLSQESEGVIVPNRAALSQLHDLNGQFIQDAWNFQAQANPGIFEPSLLIQPDDTQALFTFDPSRFISLQGSSNFLDAKAQYYSKLKYSNEEKHFLLSQSTLTDWAGLNHPPLHEIEAKDLAWIAPDSIPKKTPAIRERDQPEFQKRMDTISDSELTANNQFSVFEDRAVFPELEKLILGSKKTLWASALLLSCEPSTESLIQALEMKAEAGVDVRILVDKTMQFLQPRACVKRLRKSGVKLVEVPGMLLKASAFHIKLWVSDLSDGMILGANPTEIQTRATGFNHLFHDSGIRLEGPSVRDLASDFITLWNLYAKRSDQIETKIEAEVSRLKSEERKSGLRGSEHYAKWLSLSPNGERTPGLCRVVIQERHSQKDRVSVSLNEYLKTADQRIWFNSTRREFHQIWDHEAVPYNEPLLTAFRKAQNEKVQVEMMYNSVTHPFTPYFIPDTGLSLQDKLTLTNRILLWSLNRSSQKALNEGSVFFEEASKAAPSFRAWSYFNYSHVKNLIMDDDFLLAGSYNPMDERSARDAEIGLFCQDRSLNQIFSLHLARDLVNSTPYPKASQFQD